jgi:hypothetical protein
MSVSLKRTLLKEDTNAYNVILDLAGLIPGLGEFADAANALDYAVKGDYVMSALSIVSMIPEIGDFVGKGGKIALWVEKTFPKAFQVTAKYGPEISDAVKELRMLIQKNRTLIDRIVDLIDKDPTFAALKPHLPKINDAINMLGKELPDEEGRVDISMVKDLANLNAVEQMKESHEFKRWQLLAGI